MDINRKTLAIINIPVAYPIGEKYFDIFSEPTILTRELPSPI